MKNISTYLSASVLSLLILGATSGLSAEAQTKQKQSSYELMSSENKAMQDDASLNPAMFWVTDGQALWQEKLGPKNTACASCHGDVKQSMRGVAAQFPKMIKGKLQTLEGQINACRMNTQKAPQLAYESKELLLLTALIAMQSKGMQITVQKNTANAAQMNQGEQCGSIKEWGSSTYRALSVTKTGQVLSLEEVLFLRVIQMPTPSIDWSGRLSDQFSADCATA